MNSFCARCPPLRTNGDGAIGRRGNPRSVERVTGNRRTSRPSISRLADLGVSRPSPGAIARPRRRASSDRINAGVLVTEFASLRGRGDALSLAPEARLCQKEPSFAGALTPLIAINPAFSRESARKTRSRCWRRRLSSSVRGATSSISASASPISKRRRISQAAVKALHDGEHGYTDATGIAPLREAVAQDLHRRLRR